MERKAQPHKFKWKAFALLLTVLLLLVLAGATNHERAQLSAPERWLREAVRPLQSALVNIYAQFERIPAYFAGVSQLQAENEALRAEIALLQQELRQTAGLAAENARLWELLALEQQYAAYQPLAATVIARNTQNWRHSLTINRGANHGLAAGMPVLDAQGLVGRVVNVSARSAEVMLLTNPDHAVSARLLASGWTGVVEADRQNTGGLALIYLPLAAELTPGQVLVSSGLGGVYPANLPIGTLETVEVEADGLSQRATVRPYADFERLDQLLVLRLPQGLEDAS